MSKKKLKKYVKPVLTVIKVKDVDIKAMAGAAYRGFCMAVAGGGGGCHV